MNLKILDRINIGFNSLLELCESPIEKQFLEEFLNIISHSLFFDFNEFSDLSFSFISEVKNELRNNSTKLIQDDLITGDYYKIIGFQLNGIEKSSAILGTLISEDFNTVLDSNGYLNLYNSSKINYNENKNEITAINIIKLLPQHKVGKYRLDFAITAERYFNNEWITISKYNIECDGHEFHSTKDQIRNDNFRSRELLLDGWQTVRFSGSEIHAKKGLGKFIYELLYSMTNK
ncbi:MAG: hypothetical protein IPP61_19300 [Cytophagaceae bacterium]|nr:hypothetical protein [Cytophagaceae bacterium]MBL0300344.1 hypothetical protein [Cytophagaceae bacterium]MBL0327276.1 hypothetical protein [Cytophagaceae bacterium]